MTSERPDLEELVSEIKENMPEYIFIGESHPNPVIKTFTGDLIERLLDEGFRIGLYLEALDADSNIDKGEYTGPVFAMNPEAYKKLINKLKDRVSIYGIDTGGYFFQEERIGFWKQIIDQGEEDIKVILTGNLHMIYGKALTYEGNIVRKFDSNKSLTIALYQLQHSALSETDYVIRGLEKIGEWLHDSFPRQVQHYQTHHIADYMCFVQEPLSERGMEQGKFWEKEMTLKVSRKESKKSEQTKKK